MEMDRQDSDASESSGESFGEDDDGSSFSVDTDEDGGAAASTADTGNAAGGEGETSGVAEAAPPTAEDSSREIADLEGELYDIGLAATHSYMSAGMVRVAGRSVHEAGWAGRVPCLAHRAVVFPGEVVPMVLPRRSDVAVLRRVIRTDNLFGLLCPDETGRLISGYGVLCEVFEAGLDDKFEQPVLTFKARATQRFRLTRLNKHSVPINALDRMHYMDIKVLPEYATCESLRNARLSSLAPLHTPPRTPPRTEALRARRLEAAATPWPPFVHDRFDYRRMRKTLQEYFSSIKMYSMPVEPVSLSFWVASNLALMSRDRLALFMVDNALLRLHMECSLITRKSLLCCAACMAVIARKAHIFPMSSEGVHSNFVNLGGYMHDTLTVSRASRVQLQGAPSAEFSWFPGYAWTIATCARCQAHVGWRFEALKSTLRPQHFYGLCRNYIQPCSRRRRPRARSPRSRRSPRLPRAPHSPDSAHSSHSSDLSLF